LKQEEELSQKRKAPRRYGQKQATAERHITPFAFFHLRLGAFAKGFCFSRSQHLTLMVVP
jgi:hypothetical protein